MNAQEEDSDLPQASGSHDPRPAGAHNGDMAADGAPKMSKNAMKKAAKQVCHPSEASPNP